MPKFQKKAKPVEIDEFAPEPIFLEPTPEEAAAAQDAQQLANAPDYNPVDAGRLVEVWERRFTNPGASPSQPIALKAKGMVARWINTTIEGRYHRAVYDQGWQPVPLALLADPASIPDLYKHPHGIVCRGERGKEVLMMMPEGVFQKIQARKAELTNRSLKNLRSEIAEAASKKLSPDAADFIHSGQTADGTIKAVGSINFGTERIAMGADD